MSCVAVKLTCDGNANVKIDQLPYRGSFCVNSLPQFPSLKLSKECVIYMSLCASEELRQPLLSKNLLQMKGWAVILLARHWNRVL